MINQRRALNAGLGELFYVGLVAVTALDDSTLEVQAAEIETEPPWNLRRLLTLKTSMEHGSLTDTHGLGPPRRMRIVDGSG